MTEAERIANGLRNHTGVSEVLVEDNLLRVSRIRSSGHPDVAIRVLPTSSVSFDQIAGAEVEPGIDAYVVGHFSGTYEWKARELLNSQSVGLLTQKELWGALNSKRLHEYDSIQAKYFISRIGSHSAVSSLQRVSLDIFEVYRHRHGSLRVHAAYEYVLSEEYVRTTLADDGAIDIISNLSEWNRYTVEAANEARRLGARVFDLSGIYGALNLDREAIQEHVPKSDL